METSIDSDDDFSIPDLEDKVFRSLDWNQDEIEAEHVDMADVLDEVVEDHQAGEGDLDEAQVEVHLPDGYWKEQVRSDGRVFYIGYKTNLDEDSKMAFETSSVQSLEEAETSIG